MTDQIDFDLFTALVAAELRLRGRTFERRDLEEFMATLRPLILERDDPAWWADSFQEAQAGAAAT
jgi:hypothetical protein